MAQAGSISITPISNITGTQLRKINSGLLSMVTDIHRLATIYAPRDKGDLISSGRVEKVLGGFAVVFGGRYSIINVPYAAIRHEVNKKNPGTRKYLQRAGDQTVRQERKYFND